MPIYAYSGRHVDGSKASGTIDAVGRSEVVAQLERQAIIPVSINAVKGGKTDKGAAKKGQINFEIFETATLDEIIMLSRQLASLTRAGVPIVASLRGLSDTVKNPLIAKNLAGVADNLEKGQELSIAIAHYPKVFSDLYVSMIRIGESTGRLDDSFSQMASYLDLERKTIRNLKQATRYPTFVFAAIGVFITIINLFVIPSFKNVFDSIGGQLPWQTIALINVSDFTLAYWPHVLGVGIAASVLFYRWKKSPDGRLFWDRIKFKIPLVGGIFYRAALARFSRTFSVVLAAGMPIEQGLAVVAKAVDNEFVGAKVDQMRVGIERGEGFTSAAKRTAMFSPLVMQMLAVGEETGRVDEMLAEVADFYEEEVEHKLLGLSSAIEPILITIIGALVLVLALGVFLPLWELSSAINR
ncbi:MAG: type II secretion system F family protein [Oceanospirillaceae bacterium]|nr:type II secretion system F family protein [Oceanospirillaceae bacterium]